MSKIESEAWVWVASRGTGEKRLEILKFKSMFKGR